MARISIVGQEKTVFAAAGTRLLDVLRDAGVHMDAPCGGQGKCGKCKVLAEGREVLACKTLVDRDMTVELPRTAELNILQAGLPVMPAVDPVKDGYLLAFDLGTTSLVCFLLDGTTGKELAQSSMTNPQTAFGADVITRIRKALGGEMDRLTEAVREGMTDLIRAVCAEAAVEPERIGVVSVVGNPAMQQLFFGISPENLAAVPFAPVLTNAKTVPCGDILPICPNGALLIVPDISGYIGADTMGCILSTKLYQQQEITLLVDIGTNGEMVLGNKDRMVACSAAAGPALEGAQIRFGMRGTAGAIDHVWLEDGTVKCSVIGGGTARGICGSGLVDAVAVGLRMGLINKRGRILNEEHIFYLTEDIYLTQEDIRQVQLAKGAICAGIELMTRQMGIDVADIEQVQLAGAFGSFLDSENACRMGLLPEALLGKIRAVGNAAGSGARILACDKSMLMLTQELAERVEFLELASLPEFPKTFARAMNFREETA